MQGEHFFFKTNFKHIFCLKKVEAVGQQSGVSGGSSRKMLVSMAQSIFLIKRLEASHLSAVSRLQKFAQITDSTNSLASQ
jgi:hypothetical protein